MKPHTKPVLLSFKAYVRIRGRQKLYDPTNYATSAKIIEDCLVTFGILPNDTSEFVRGVFLAPPERIDSGDSYMLVTIQEILLQVADDKGDSNGNSTTESTPD